MEKKVEYMARMADGSEIKIYPDAHHYRAFNAAGVQVGEPFIKLQDLLESLAAKLATAQGSGNPAEWPQPKEDVQAAAELPAAAPASSEGQEVPGAPEQVEEAPKEEEEIVH